MLGHFWVDEQLPASQEGLNTMKWLLKRNNTASFDCSSALYTILSSTGGNTFLCFCNINVNTFSMLFINRVSIIFGEKILLSHNSLKYIQLMPHRRGGDERMSMRTWKYQVAPRRWGRHKDLSKSRNLHNCIILILIELPNYNMLFHCLFEFD
jgi:hypothetical protein